MSDNSVIQLGRISVNKSEILGFAISSIIFTLILLYLFRFWFVVYLILFFISAWTLVSASFKHKTLKAVFFGYFFGYIFSAITGFFFLGVV